MTLEPMEPRQGLSLYLADRENEVSKATLYSHRSRLGHLVRWCEQEGITNTNKLTGRKLHEFRLWRRQDGDLAKASEKTQMDTLRVFVKWLANIDAVDPDLHAKIRSPTLSGKDDVRDVMLTMDRTNSIIEYVEKYQYASREHLVLSLMAHCMMRIGSIRALDTKDYDSDDQSIEVVHRPESGTPLKTKNEGERFVALSEDICKLIDDWITDQRPNITDKHGREPLIPTPRGRVHQSTLRNDIYRITRPCVIGDHCPENRNVETCEARSYEEASKCPESKSPHTVRRGSLTHALTKDYPMADLGNRAAVSEAVLEAHYDRRSKRQKMEQRRDHLDKI